MKSYKKTLIYLFCIFSFFSISCRDEIYLPIDENLELSSFSSDDIQELVSGSLILDTIKILIKDIKLNITNTEDSIDYSVGPYVIYLDLNSLVRNFTSDIIPSGNYDKIFFDIHKLEDNETPPDPDFSDLNGRYSIIVKGRYNDTSFVYKSSASVHHKLIFPNSLYISVSGKSNITIHIKPYIWFIKNSIYLDPRNPVNRSDIDDNIKNNINNNIRAFKDNNKDGLPDN